MKPSQPLDTLVSRSKKQMVSVRKNDLSVKVAFEITGADRLNRSLCPYRHERRRFDRAMWRMQKAGASSSLWTFSLYLEAQRRHPTDIFADSSLPV